MMCRCDLRYFSKGEAVSLALAGIEKSVEGIPWLYGIDLVAAEGLTVLAGPTLAGKTTIMRIAAGLERPTSGTVVLDDVDVTAVNVRKRDVGFVYQEFINYPAMTVKENISAPLKRSGLQKADVDSRVTEVADLLKLGPYMARRPGDLSGGQQQRLAIARALAKRARLLILDEPLANLDYKLREELRDELFRIFAKRESIVLYSTTEPVEALTFGGSTVVMDAGKVLQVSSAIEAFRQPSSSAVARVFCDPPMNIMEASLSATSVSVGAGVSAARPDHFSDLGGPEVDLGIHPHRVYLNRKYVDDLELQGEVALAELTGSETYVHVKHAAGSLVVQASGAHTFNLGERLSVFLPTQALFAFDRTSGLLLAHPLWEKADHG
jgi:glycerol transport system ATP-binding protein